MGGVSAACEVGAEVLSSVYVTVFAFAALTALSSGYGFVERAKAIWGTVVTARGLTMKQE